MISGALYVLAIVLGFIHLRRERANKVIPWPIAAPVQKNKQIVTLSPIQNVHVSGGATKESTELDKVDSRNPGNSERPPEWVL
jgi:hypothetical protein